ncbi:MAG: HAD family hydrolase [Gammaproteobacteria bacterium]|nr:HAD family hydrolase [Gammaproteobacteria bacterium]
MPITHLSFDLDDTLWPCAPVIRAAEAKAYDFLNTHWHGDVPLETADALLASRKQFFATNTQWHHDLTTMRREWVRQTLGHGLSAPLQAQYMELILEYRNFVIPYDDVIPVLDELKHRYTLVSITNGNADVFKTPLAPYFERAYNSIGAGVAKPHPAIFKQVLDNEGIDSDNLIHIGDDQHTDVHGAFTANIQPIWINRTEQPWRADTAQPHTAKDLKELMTLLETL